jgi:hypothetical protein
MKHDIIATLGDAVASFLKDPDAFTKACCLLTKEDVINKRWASIRPVPTKWHSEKPFWFRASSLKRWIIKILLAGGTLGVTGYLLSMGLVNLRGHERPTGLTDLWNMGFRRC